MGLVYFVTGGTGFLGRRLIRELLKRDDVSKVISYSRRWDTAKELQQNIADPRLRIILGDVCDLKQLRLSVRGVNRVIHTAALKSVDMGEYNFFETARVNIGGSENVIRAAIESGVERCMFISSDKAAAPYNLYGKTKAVSESMFVNANNLSGTRFFVVRYGNVINSTGSVVPFFIDKLKRGAASLPVTDPNCTRFWFPPSEAVDWVLRCFHTGEEGAIYVPKLKASTMETLVGAFSIMYDREIEMDIVGMRPGEKLHEEMITANEVGYDLGWTCFIPPVQHDWDAGWRQRPSLVHNIPIFGLASDRVSRYTRHELAELLSEIRKPS